MTPGQPIDRDLVAALVRAGCRVYATLANRPARSLDDRSLEWLIRAEVVRMFADQLENTQVKR